MIAVSTAVTRVAAHATVAMARLQSHKCDGAIAVITATAQLQLQDCNSPAVVALRCLSSPASHASCGLLQDKASYCVLCKLAQELLLRHPPHHVDEGSCSGTSLSNWLITSLASSVAGSFAKGCRLVPLLPGLASMAELYLILRSQLPLLILGM